MNTPGRGIIRLFGSLTTALSSSRARAVLFNRSTSADAGVRFATAQLIAAVSNAGDAALRQMARKFDSVSLTDIEVPRAQMSAALAAISPDLRRAMERAADNIRRAHEGTVPPQRTIETEPGIMVGRRPDPFECVGLYAPGGRAAYPSSVLMGAIPARVAGVRQIILCSPPGSNGLPAQPVLAAAALTGVDRVFAVGGAGAIAAMTFGTESIPRAQKIVGPGNSWVAEAKLQLAGFVSFDSPAGPSELLVIADDGANPAVVVREMLAQAEHDPLACVVVSCASRELCEPVLSGVSSSIAMQPRAEIIAAALRDHGAVFWCGSGEQTIAFANEYAPEHLLIATREPQELAALVRNAGTIFLGETSSVSFGDYMTGANHVLPTGGLARSYSGLSALDFVRWTTWQSISRAAARSLADDVATFAEAESLDAHAAAARAWGEG